MITKKEYLIKEYDNKKTNMWLKSITKKVYVIKEYDNKKRIFD